jgi:hypothetical protein
MVASSPLFLDHAITVDSTGDDGMSFHISGPRTSSKSAPAVWTLVGEIPDDCPDVFMAVWVSMHSSLFLSRAFWQAEQSSPMKGRKLKA